MFAGAGPNERARHASSPSAPSAPSSPVRDTRRLRLALLACVVPWLMLAELDRELAGVGASGAALRVLADLFVAAIATVDLARRVPRHPRTTAIVLLAGAARFLLFVSKSCGHAHVILYAAMLVSLLGGVVILAFVPSPARLPTVALRPTSTTIASAVAVAAGLPLVLLAAEWASIGLGVRALVFASYGILPSLVELVVERAPKRRFAPALRTLYAIAIGLALTLGLTSGARYTLDAGVYATRCADPAAFESSGARRALEQQTLEVTRSLKRDRESLALFVLNILVVPLVEERVYRGLLQRVLVARWGTTKGIALAALFFGVAHLGVYRYAAYQTVLLGVSFGAAYGEAGLVASTALHGLWNLYILS
jgi:membrane protease YdiL (CAAX protease family)